MRRWFLTAGLAIGSAFTLGCEERAEQAPVERAVVDDSPLAGVWYLQSAGERPIAIDSTIRFEFKPDGLAVYERATGGPEQPDRYELAYNLAGPIISIDSEAANDAPGVPRITGKIELDDEGQTLRITTHTDEDWLLTRKKLPGGAVEEARRFQQVKSQTDPRLTRVQRLAYACSAYVDKHGRAPEQAYDLVRAKLIEPQALTVSGKASDLPTRFDRMSEAERSAWLETNSGFVFFFRYAGTGQASSVVVSMLPDNGKSRVAVGMANGAAYIKHAKDAAQLLQFQTGKLPDRWPESAWSREATAGLEPLSD